MNSIDTYSQWPIDLTSPQAVEIQNHDVAEDIRYWEGRKASINSRIAQMQYNLESYLQLCSSENLRPDTSGISLFQQTLSFAKQELQLMDPHSLLTTNNLEYGGHITRQMQQYRSLMHSILQMSLCIDWRSAAYEQTAHPMFFTKRSLNNSGFNYNRYEGEQLEALEKQMTEVLQLDDSNSLLVTSSGMAAYNVIESYLLRHVVQPGDKVYIPNTMYCEAAEQLLMLPYIEYHKGESFAPDVIINYIAEARPRVVILDTMSNDAALRLNDIKSIIDGLHSLDIGTVSLIVDGTLTPAITQPIPTNLQNNLQLIYFESGSKYMQLGLDMTMCGMIVYPKSIHAKMEQLRRTTGSILYDSGSNAVPEFDTETYIHRLKRMNRNAILIGTILERDERLKGIFNINHPLLHTHPDYQLAIERNLMSTLLTVTYKEESRNTREQINLFISRLIKLCRKHDVSMSKGESFGFSTPRVLANSETMDMAAQRYLRVSSGDRSFLETTVFANLLAQSLYDE